MWCEDSHIGIYTRFLLDYHPQPAIYITWLDQVNVLYGTLVTYAVTSLATYLGPLWYASYLRCHVVSYLPRSGGGTLGMPTVLLSKRW